VASVDGLLVLDEAYGQFSPFSGETLLGAEVPLVVSRTYSKTWAMAAARLGYLLGPAWLVEDLEKVVLPYHLDALKQEAGLAALGFLDEMEERVTLIVEERGRIETSLTELGATVWPSGANFILFRPPAGNGEEVWQRLVDASVLVRNTASWDHLAGCLRVTVGTPGDNTRFLTAFREAIT
jgi:histidinol-phosphate aminotransferase